MATEIESLLEYTLNVGASELVVTEGASSAVRLAGKVCAIPDAPAVEPGALVEKTTVVSAIVYSKLPLVRV